MRHTTEAVALSLDDQRRGLVDPARSRGDSLALPRMEAESSVAMSI